jgi:nitroreductase
LDFLKLAEKRYSVRAYKPAEVEQDKLDYVLQAARMAPTACNLQPFRLIVIRTRGKEDELRRIYKADWFAQAPLVICVCAVPSMAWLRMDGKNYCDVDATIVMDHLVLAATEIGLGTCWIGAFNPGEARRILDIPDELVPVAFTPLGYPADSPPKKTRKPISDLVEYKFR